MSVVRTIRSKICGECKGPLVHTYSDLVCSQCGVVNGKIIVNPTMKTYPDKEEAHYEPSKRPDHANDLGTPAGILLKKDLQHLPQEKQEAFRRQKQLEKLNRKLSEQEKKEQRMEKALKVLSELITVLKLPANIKEQAAQVYRLYEKDLKSEKYGTKVGGTLYFVMRTNRLGGYSLREFVKTCEDLGYPTRPGKITQIVHYLQQKTHRQLRVSKPLELFEALLSKFLGDPEVQGYLAKHRCSPEHFSQEIRPFYTTLAEKIPDEVRIGKNPSILAALLLMGATWVYGSTYAGKVNFIPFRIFNAVFSGSMEQMFRTNKVAHYVAQMLTPHNENSRIEPLNSITTEKHPEIPDWDLHQFIKPLAEPLKQPSIPPTRPLMPLQDLTIPILPEPEDDKRFSIENRLRELQSSERRRERRRKKPHMEQALVLYEYKRKNNLTNEELGYLVDLGKTQIGTLISLVKLPPKIQRGITDGQITVEAAKVLSKLAFDVVYPNLGTSVEKWDFDWEAEPEAWKAKRIKIQLDFFEKIKLGNFSGKKGIKELQSIIHDVITLEKQQRKQTERKINQTQEITSSPVTGLPQPAYSN